MAFRDGLQMGILKEEEGLLMGEWGVEAQRDKVWRGWRLKRLIKDWEYVYVYIWCAHIAREEKRRQPPHCYQSLANKTAPHKQQWIFLYPRHGWDCTQQASVQLTRSQTKRCVRDTIELGYDEHRQVIARRAALSVKKRRRDGYLRPRTILYVQVLFLLLICMQKPRDS